MPVDLDQSTCQPWATLADLCEPCDDYASAADRLEDLLQVASNVLFHLSGRRFPGECTSTVRPCAQTPYCSGPPCGCSRLSVIRLGSQASAITEVLIDGVVVPPTRYRLDPGGALVRLPDEPGDRLGRAWPCCQRLDLPATERDTFEVEFVWGVAPPPEGVMAAAVLACELWLACDEERSGECSLPQRVQTVTRQGIAIGAILDPFAFLEDGKTGLYLVDLFLRSSNPGGLPRPPQVWSPDVNPDYRRL